MKDDLLLYPGGEIVSRGLDDLEDGRLSEDALLVLEWRPRLEGLGIQVPVSEQAPREPRLRLYEMLAEKDESWAYNNYNALRRRLASFANAYEHHFRRNEELHNSGER